MIARRVSIEHHIKYENKRYSLEIMAGNRRRYHRDFVFIKPQYDIGGEVSQLLVYSEPNASDATFVGVGIPVREPIE